MAPLVHRIDYNDMPATCSSVLLAPTAKPLYSLQPEHKAQICSNDEVMANLLKLQISTQQTFSNKGYKALKLQIWKF